MSKFLIVATLLASSLSSFAGCCYTSCFFVLWAGQRLDFCEEIVIDGPCPDYNAN